MQGTVPEEYLIECFEKGNLPVIRAFLDKGFDVNYRFQSKPHHGSTPLILATYFGHAHIVEELLERDADINMSNYSNLTAVFWANHGGHKDISKLLREAEVFNALPEVQKAGNQRWIKLSEYEIAYTTLHRKTYRKISRVFNFYARDMVVMSENLKTNAEAVSSPASFDSIDLVLLKDAFKAFEAAGGKADKEQVFKGRIIFKNDNDNKIDKHL